MIQTDDKIIIDFKEYETYDELVDLFFWNDLYFEHDDTVYIHDAFNGYWYMVERAYVYSSYGAWTFHEKGLKVRFDRLSEDVEKELDEEFYKDM